MSELSISDWGIIGFNGSRGGAEARGAFFVRAEPAEIAEKLVATRALKKSRSQHMLKSSHYGVSAASTFSPRSLRALREIFIFLRASAPPRETLSIQQISAHSA